jgi:tRNA 5-methylaminomethyl-2-thiouridine biosynthesis bifunctional protein
VPTISDNDSPGYLQPYAQVEWDSSGAPHSGDYGDIYWNPNQGIEEKLYVFIEANKLRERWQNTSSSFSILELGFGFGLNCLLAARLWQMLQNEKRTPAQIQKGPILNFISIEKHPVDANALRKVYQTLDEAGLSSLSSCLIKNYPENSRGTHLIWLADNICLTLILGEDTDALEEVCGHVDAIFLDGFSPSKNERMWNIDLLSKLPPLCHAETTLSTYSVSGALRRGLTESGFTFQRIKGFGRKHEMLTAMLISSTVKTSLAQAASKKQKLTDAPIIIIGSGIAGLACAKSLLKRGHLIVLIDKATKPITGASSINQMAVYPHISVRPDPFSVFSLSAFQYSLRENHAELCGYTRYAENETEASRLQRISNDFSDQFITCERVGDSFSLTHKRGSWLNVADAYAETLAQITIKSGVEIASVVKSENGWELFDTKGDFVCESATVIFATGHSNLDLLAPIGLNSNRGQAISVRTRPSTDGTNLNEAIVSKEKTLFPQDKYGNRTFSATNSRDSVSLIPSQTDTNNLIAALKTILSEPFELTSEQVGIRCTSRDRMPTVGQIPNWPALDDYCEQNRHRKELEEFKVYEDGLFVCTGFGAHGATHAPACGEYIARLVCGEPSPKSWGKLLNPGRFKLRDRNK